MNHLLEELASAVVKNAGRLVAILMNGSDE